MKTNIIKSIFLIILAGNTSCCAVLSRAYVRGKNIFSFREKSRFHTSALIENKLNILNLKQVLNNQKKCIRIGNFLSSQVCDYAMKKINNYPTEDYVNAKGVKKIKNFGTAYFEIEKDKSLERAYYKNALSNIGYLRENIFAPYLSPLDKLRLELQEIWPKGCDLLDIGKGKMFCGLIRLLDSEVLAHEDKLERDLAIDVATILEYQGQLAANIYLSTPTVGGDLLLYDISLDDKTYDEIRGNTYGIPLEKIECKPFQIHPEKGDLIIFNPRNLHAISKNELLDTSRVTISTFMLYAGLHQPLRLWS